MYFLDKDKLEGEYKEAFSRVEAYSVIQGVQEEDEEEMLANLVDMFYTAQVEGKPVEKIIGNDIEKFCKQYFSEYGRFGSLFSNVPAMIYRIMWFMLFCSVLEFISLSKKGTVDILMASTDVSSFMVAILTCIVSLFLTMILLKPILFRLKKINVLVVSAIQLVITVLLVAVLFVFMGDKIFSAPLYMVLLGGIGYIVLYKTLVLYKRYKKTGSVKKEVNEDSLRYLMKESIQTTVDTDLPIGLKKKFLDKNEKLRKKGKKELTPEEYMEFLYHENDEVKKTNIFLIVFYAIMTVVLIAGIAIDSTILTAITAAITISFIFGAICWAVTAFNRKMIKTREGVLRRCEEQGITIIEMAERIEKEQAEIIKDVEKEETI